MKYRNGFVSNSSSTSFIITGDALKFFTENHGYDYDDSPYTVSTPDTSIHDINDYCVKLTDKQKEAIDKIPDDKKHLDWYMTAFLSEMSYLPSTHEEDVIEYADGNHGGPYSVDRWDMISTWTDRSIYGQVWIQKEDNK